MLSEHTNKLLKIQKDFYKLMKDSVKKDKEPIDAFDVFNEKQD